MPNQVVCSGCGETVKIKGSRNPHACKCGKQFNVVTRSVAIRLGDLNPESAEKLLTEFAAVVNQFIREFAKRFFQNFTIIEKEEGTCCLCGQQKSLTMQSEAGKCCATCGNNYICGDQAYRDLYAGIKDASPMSRKTYVDRAFQQAKILFSRWLGDNWGVLLRKGQVTEQLKQCQVIGKGKVVEREPERITQIRAIWSDIKTPMSPFWFFQTYYRGRVIRQRNRTKRRESLKAIAKSLEGKMIERGTLPELAYLVAKPICEECEHAEKYSWGWECELDQTLGHTQSKAKRKRRIKVGKLPVLRGTVAKMPSHAYQIKINQAVVELGLCDRDTKEKASILGSEWLNTYGKGVFSDNSRYPTLQRVEAGKEKGYYLIYPLSEVVPLQAGEWQHIIVYGLTKTCVFSLCNGQTRVRFWNHHAQGKQNHPRGLVAVKEYHQAQRRKAKRGFFDKPRQKERHIIHTILHQETAQISEYLGAMPGQVTLLNMQKALFPRGTLYRKELNSIISLWNDSIFRELAKYKLELQGLAVREHKLDTTKLGTCPSCGAELKGGGVEIQERQDQESSESDGEDWEPEDAEEALRLENDRKFAERRQKMIETFKKGGTWQSLVVVARRKSTQCACGNDDNILLAMAKMVSREI